MEAGVQENNELSFKDVVEKVRKGIQYLKSQCVKMIIIGFLGGVIGLVYAWVKPITYTAETTFVVEESKSVGGLNGLASLAGQFGIDIGSTAGGGLITGDNIFLYFKSESLIRDVLLSNWDNNRSFADKYIEINGFASKWDKIENLKSISIPPKKANTVNSRKQDSILNFLVHKIITEDIDISKVDKKASFIALTTTMPNEEYAKRFCDQVVNAATSNYIKLKTDRQKITVDILQKRADSIASLLNQKTGQLSSLQTSNSTMDVNPIYKTPSAVQTELVMRDKNMLGAIYIEVIKNLELAKFTLSQETPVIQIINSSIYPLSENRLSKTKAIFVSGLFFVMMSIFFFLIKYWLKDFQNER